MPVDILPAILFAIIAFAVLACAAGWLASTPLHAAALVFGLALLTASNTSLGFKLGIWLYPQDLFFVVLGIACLIRFSLFASPKSVPPVWWMLGAVQLLLLAWGTSRFGTAAGVDSRAHFYVWVAVAYFCSVQWTDAMMGRVVNAWIACATMLCLLACYRWIGSAIDPAYAAQIMALDTTGGRFRVVGAEAALMIAIGILFLLFKMMAGKLPLFQRLLLPVLTLSVVVLQHRSVWVSLCIGVACLLWIQRRERKPVRTALGVGLMALPLAVLLTIPGQGNSIVDSLKSSAGQAVSTQEGTMVGRVMNWQELLTKWAYSKNPVTYLIGMPYGSGYNPVELEDGTGTNDMVPHNHLVHILYRGGLIGVFATLFIFYRLWVRAVEAARTARQRWAACFPVILAALFAYYIPYWASIVDAMLIGIAISYLGIQQRTRQVVLEAARRPI
jgi:hypothetical protein